MPFPDLINKCPAKSNPTNWNECDEILIRKTGRSGLGGGKTGLAWYRFQMTQSVKTRLTVLLPWQIQNFERTQFSVNSIPLCNDLWCALAINNLINKLS